MKVLNNKTYEQLRLQAKGYEDMKDNKDNILFRSLQAYLKGTELPPFVPTSRDQIKTVYETCGPLYGVINRIAPNVGEVSAYLELHSRKDGSLVEKHDVLDLINNPNDRYTRARYVTAWAVNRLLYGDAWQYVKATIGADRHKELYIIPSHLVEVKKGGVAQPFESVKISGGTMEEIPLSDIIESFDYNLDPASPFGTSKAVAAGAYLAVINKGMQRQDFALTNGGAANIITPKASELGIKPSDAEEIEKKSNSLKNTNKTVTFKSAIEVHQLGNNPTDLGIMDAHKEAVTALCFTYGLPVDLFYGESKYENAKEAKKTIYEQNAIPLCEEFANDILRHFGLGDEFYFEVNRDRIDILQASPTDVLTNLEKMHASLNEMREAYGYEPIPEDWANQPILPVGIQFGNEGGYDISE